MPSTNLRLTWGAGASAPRLLVARGARLIHGNELLAAVHPDYSNLNGANYRRRDHTLRRVASYLRRAAGLGPPYGFQTEPGLESAFDVFVGYLMFDAWIGNQDRHDNNWGVLRDVDGHLFLSPSYDHGSSLARNASDAQREVMMTTRDRGQHIDQYVARARSALYPHDRSDQRVKPYLTIEAYASAAKIAPQAAAAWRSRLALVQDEAIDEIIGAVPVDWMSDTSRLFTKRFLVINRQRILDLA